MSNYTLWCIVTPSGTPIASSARRTRKESVEWIVWGFGNDWPDIYRSGYRCRKFRLVEDDK